MGYVLVGKDFRVAQGVATHDVEVVGTMQEEVHLGYGGIGDVLLLSEDGSTALGIVLHVVDSLDEHTAGAAGRVVDRFAGLRVENANQQLHHRTRGVEFASLGFREIGKLLQQHLVGIAHQVGIVVVVAQAALAHVLYEVAKLLVGEHVLVAPVGRREHTQHTIQGHWVGEFYLAHRTDDGTTDVGSALAHIVPMATFGYHEAMLLGQRGKLLVAI